jgi:hypothetical protein
MRCPEPLLDQLESLLTPEPWLRDRCSPADADRHALACALAWLCGVKAGEMGRMAVGDARPDGLPLVVVAPGGGGASGRVQRQPRLIPVSPPVEAALDRRLAAFPGAPPEALLLGGGGDWRTDPRAVLETLGVRLKRITGGRIAGLPDLTRRFASSPATDAWLTGSSTLLHGAEPAMAVLRARLFAAHPALLPSRLRGRWLRAGGTGAEPRDDNG